MSLRDLLVCLSLAMPIASYGGPMACQLPALGKNVKSGSSLPGDQREAAYRSFVDRVMDLADKRDMNAVKSCCATAGMRSITAPPCSLAKYTAGEKQDAKSFVSEVPLRKNAIDWLWRWDALIQRTGGAPRYPDGFAAAYLDQLFALTDKQPLALKRIFTIYRYADGEYAEYIADKLVTLMEHEPDLVLSRWPDVSANQRLVQRALDLDADRRRDLQTVYRRACDRPGAPASCREVMKLLGG